METRAWSLLSWKTYHLVLVRQQVVGVRLQFDEVRLKVLHLDGAEGDKVGQGLSEELKGLQTNTLKMFVFSPGDTTVPAE